MCLVRSDNDASGRQRSQKLTDVIACRSDVEMHSVEGVLVGLAKACQQSGGKRTAGKTEVVVLHCCHAWMLTAAEVALSA
jgi:hypothetical protein